MKLFLQIYYSLFLYILLRVSYKLVNYIPALEPDYIFFARPLNFFEVPPILHSALFLMAFFLTLFCMFKPYRILRIAQSFFVLIVFSVFYSYGKVDHPYHPWILSSLFVCFFNEIKPLNSSQNFFQLRLIQGLLLSHYFMSGLWKLRYLFKSEFPYSFQSIITEYIAYGMAEKPPYNNPLLDFFLYQQPWLLSLGYICVLLFQITSLAPIFFNRFFVFYGVLACLFHLATGLVLSIYFFPTVLALLFFFIVAESIRKYKFPKIQK